MIDPLEFSHAMSEQDAMFWNLERHAGMRATVLAVSVLDRIPARDRTMRKIAVAARRIPRLRQRVVTLPSLLSTPLWVEVPHFDLDYHVRWIGAPGGRTIADVLALASSLAMQSFDYARPLWEFTIVEGLDDDGAAIIQKLHHSITDGAAGVRLMREFYDLERDPEESPAEFNIDSNFDFASNHVPSRLELGMDALKRRIFEQPRLARRRIRARLEAIRSPLHTAREAYEELNSVFELYGKGPGPLSPSMAGRSDSVRFGLIHARLEALKEASHAAGCKLNDAFLAALAGGFRLYHERRGCEVAELQLTLPINLRSDGAISRAGNDVSVARILLPVAERDPILRMRACRRLVAGRRERPSSATMDVLASGLNVLPPALVRWAAPRLAATNDVVASCVPGLSIPLFLAGAEIKSLYTFGPLARSAANFTLFSYRGQASVAVVVDPAAIPDRAVLLECMQEGFDEILKLG